MSKHEENWVTFHVLVDDEPGTCVMDIGFEGADAARPLCTQVRVPFKSPGENGFGAQDERDAIAALEDALTARTAESCRTVNFATVRGGGAIQVFFYSPQAAEQEIKRAAEECFKGYPAEVESWADARWESYQRMFPGPAQLRWIADERLVRVLRQNGDESHVPRPVEHWAYFPSAAGAESFVKAASAEGFEVARRLTGEDLGSSAGVQVTKRHSVTLDQAFKESSTLDGIARQHGGRYDGWETPIVKRGKVIRPTA